ncbi:unnamed protein product, partial [Polarella glacialis]
MAIQHAADVRTSQAASPAKSRSTLFRRPVSRELLDCTAAVSSEARRSRWRDASQLLGSAQLRALEPDAFVFQALLSSARDTSGCLRWSQALLLLQRLRQRGPEPDAACLTSVVAACSRQWQLALALFAGSWQEATLPAARTFVAAFGALREGGQWHVALQLLQEMPEKSLEPNIIVANAAIAACSSEGALAAAQLVLRGLKGLGLEPDRVSFNAAVGACARAACWEVATGLVQALREAAADGGPDVVSFNSLSTCYERAGLWPLALRSLHDMGVERVLPDVVSFSAAAGACSRTRFTYGLATLEETKVAVGACARGVEWSKSLGLFRRMQRQGPPPDAVSLTALLGACQRACQWECSLALLQLSGGAPDAAAFTACLLAL